MLPAHSSLLTACNDDPRQYIYQFLNIPPICPQFIAMKKCIHLPLFGHTNRHFILRNIFRASAHKLLVNCYVLLAKTGSIMWTNFARNSGVRLDCITKLLLCCKTHFLKSAFSEEERSPRLQEFPFMLIQTDSSQQHRECQSANLHTSPADP